MFGSNFRKWALAAFVIIAPVSAGAAVLLPVLDEYKSGTVWPEPQMVKPGVATENAFCSAPSDAVVLFDGTDLDQWQGGDRWELKDDYAITRGGDIQTKQSYGDCQLHIEFATPDKVEGNGQGRGNSGIYFMNRYEVQVLDSMDNPTYFDGQCGSVYKQSPPMVNVSRGPGQWQAFDIIFTAPRFNEDGSIQSNAFLTVLHNGVLVQNHFELNGKTLWDAPPSYDTHELKQPLKLQFHGNETRFRNIWIRENVQNMVGTAAEGKSAQ